MDVEMSSMDAAFGRVALMIPGGFPIWQISTIAGILTFMYIAKVMQLTLAVRSQMRPWTVKWVKQGLWVVLGAQVSKGSTLHVCSEC